MSGPTSSATLTEITGFPQGAQSAAAALLDSVKNEPLQFFSKATIASIKELSKECVSKEMVKRTALARLTTLQQEIEVKLTQERYRYDRKYVCSLRTSKVKADSIRLFYLKEWGNQIKNEPKSDIVARCRAEIQPIAVSVDTTLAGVNTHLFTATEGLFQGAKILRLLFGQLKSGFDVADTLGAAIRDAFSRLLSRDWFNAGVAFEAAYFDWFGTKKTSRFAQLTQSYNGLLNTSRSLVWNAGKIGFDYPSQLKSCKDWNNLTFTARVVNDSGKDAVSIVRMAPDIIDSFPLSDFRSLAQLLSTFVDETLKFVAVQPSDDLGDYSKQGFARLKDKMKFIIPFMYVNRKLSEVFFNIAEPKRKSWGIDNLEANYTALCYGIYLVGLDAVRIKDTLRHWLGYLNSNDSNSSLPFGVSLNSDLVKVRATASDANRIVDSSIRYSDLILGTRAGQGPSTGLLHLMGVNTLSELAAFPCDRHPLPSGQFLSPQRCFIATYEIDSCNQDDLTYTGIPKKVKENWRKEIIALLNVLMPCNVAISGIRASILSPSTLVRRNPSEFIPSSDELIKRIYNE